MEVILLERVAKLGQMGEVVRVKDGYARNFLLKRGKALRATADNRAKYDGMKAELEANNIQAKGEAGKVAEKIEGRDIVIIRQASESGQLFGSVSVRDIVVALAADGITVSRPQVWLDAPIKAIGQQKVTIAVHPEIEATITVTVARNADEAARIKRGEDISTRQEDRDAAAEAIAAAGEFFDPKPYRPNWRRSRALRPSSPKPFGAFDTKKPGQRPGLNLAANQPAKNAVTGKSVAPAAPLAAPAKARKRSWPAAPKPQALTVEVQPARAILQMQSWAPPRALKQPWEPQARKQRPAARASRQGPDPDEPRACRPWCYPFAYRS